MNNKVKCLNCGKEAFSKTIVIKKDKLGNYTVCNKCGCTFDIEDQF